VATDVSVVVPFRTDCPHRLNAVEFVQHWWQQHFPHWQLHVGGVDPGDGPWVKACHVDHLMQRVDTEVVVVADADVILDDPAAMRAAVDNLNGWSVPHKWVVRWDEASTGRLYEGATPTITTQPPYVGYLGGGVTVLPADAYRTVPLDPRFEGWGQEDESWAIALRCMFGDPWRGRAKLWHLWHPPQQRDSRRWGSSASKALAMRYRNAAEDRDAMRALLAEVS
jgi:hypothetical protein